MSLGGFTREELQEAHEAYAKRTSDSWYHFRPYGRRRSDTIGDEYECVYRSLEERTVWCYLAIVAQREGSDVAAEIAENWARIEDPAGVCIYLETSDDDPLQITAHIHDPIANAWCDYHSLDGGTWECADGPEFCYDILYWRPGLFDDLRKEGFRFDFSQYYEPDESDIETAEHAYECRECDYDFRKAEKHLHQEVSS